MKTKDQIEQEKTKRPRAGERLRKLRLAHQIADDLFVNGVGERARRLQLKGPAEEDFGGWCYVAVVSKVAAIIAKAEGKE